MSIQDRYQLVYLDVFKYDSSNATGINNKGQVCGEVIRNENVNIYIWNPEQKLKKKLKVGCVEASTKPVINNLGEVFGSFLKRKIDGYWEFNQESTYMWKDQYKNPSWVTLGYPKSQASKPLDMKLLRTCVWSANDHGQVLLMNSPASFEDALFFMSDKYRIWIYEKGDFEEITNSKFTVATRINNKSQVLVHLYKFNTLKNDIQRCGVAIYDHKNRSMQALSFEGDVWGNDMNDTGQVVGAFYSPLHGKYHGFLVGHNHENFLSFEEFIPCALNNHGLLIGYFNDEKKTPAVWDNGCLYALSDLTDLVDNRGNVWDSILSLNGVNDRGEIIGKGVYKGAEHGFLLRPNQLPGDLWLELEWSHLQDGELIETRDLLGQ